MKDQIINKIRKAGSALIVGHVRPDGDCIGACLAMRQICLNAGVKVVDIAVPSNIPDAYKFLEDWQLFNKINRSHFDLFISVDCANIERINRLDVFLRSAKSTICIDHHLGNDGFCDINCVVPEACSCCEILYDIFADSGLIDKIAANHLFMGLSSDTGHFMHNNVSSKVLRTAYELSLKGADCHTIAENLYRRRTREKTMLIGRSLMGIRYYENGRIAIAANALEDLEACGVYPSDTEGIIDYTISVIGTDIGVSICEETEDSYKVSFRSKGIDVNEIAAEFGGGGHKYAAGCRIAGDKEEVIRKILEAIKKHW